MLIAGLNSQIFMKIFYSLFPVCSLWWLGQQAFSTILFFMFPCKIRWQVSMEFPENRSKMIGVGISYKQGGFQNGMAWFNEFHGFFHTFLVYKFANGAAHLSPKTVFQIWLVDAHPPGHGGNCGRGLSYSFCKISTASSTAALNFQLVVTLFPDFPKSRPRSPHRNSRAWDSKCSFPWRVFFFKTKQIPCHEHHLVCLGHPAGKLFFDSKNNRLKKYKARCQFPGLLSSPCRFSEGFHMDPVKKSGNRKMLCTDNFMFSHSFCMFFNESSQL